MINPFRFNSFFFALTSMSLNTIGGSRFLRRSSSAARSRASSSICASDGSISCGIECPLAPFNSAASTSDILFVELTKLSLSEQLLEFFFFFLSFFFSFLVSLSLMADRLLSNSNDCKRAASISVFNSSKPGLCPRALTCGSNENVVSVPVPPLICSDKSRKEENVK